MVLQTFLCVPKMQCKIDQWFSGIKENSVNFGVR